MKARLPPAPACRRGDSFQIQTTAWSTEPEIIARIVRGRPRRLVTFDSCIKPDVVSLEGSGRSGSRDGVRVPSEILVCYVLHAGTNSATIPLYPAV